MIAGYTPKTQASGGHYTRAQLARCFSFDSTLLGRLMQDYAAAAAA